RRKRREEPAELASESTRDGCTQRSTIGSFAIPYLQTVAFLPVLRKRLFQNCRWAAITRCILSSLVQMEASTWTWPVRLTPVRLRIGNRRFRENSHVQSSRRAVGYGVSMPTKPTRCSLPRRGMQLGSVMGRALPLTPPDAFL